MGPLGRMLTVARRRGITRGLLGASTPWLLAGLAAWALWGLRRAFWPTEAGARTGVRLRPGERVVVEHGPRRC